MAGTSVSVHRWKLLKCTHEHKTYVSSVEVHISKQLCTIVHNLTQNQICRVQRHFCCIICALVASSKSEVRNMVSFVFIYIRAGINLKIRCSTALASECPLFKFRPLVCNIVSCCCIFLHTIPALF